MASATFLSTTRAISASDASLVPRCLRIPTTRDPGVGAERSLNAAFKLRSAPTPGSRVVGIRRQRGTRLASDAEIALVVLRKVADAILVHVVPNLSPTPVREEAHFP